MLHLRNLQDAVGAYYDHGHANNVGEIGFDLPRLNMQLVKDVTVGEMISLSLKCREGLIVIISFPLKKYMIRGTPLSSDKRVPVASLGPGGEAELTVWMLSPSLPGIYQSRWQLNTPQSVPFGEAIWCIISVDATGILDITQQLANAPLGRLSLPTGLNPFMASSPVAASIDSLSSVTIPHEDSADSPPCAPSTPPHYERE
ncbi:unnamed protein product [Angiostrongylus costaricensis]|uniref:N_BRCA1_IG domain-containing protein n=1 Tax=Angiostrongylus costaricensis TaxID=334426 RepID=A0A0R3PLG6_ANGCS|nr:unnamed protein product [Angiostrongylus costaricensis]